MRILHAAIAAGLCAATPALAALKPGVTAPDFSAASTMGGRAYSFHLADALKNGPVVLYFYPAAFTSGCTQEAHDFADAMDKFTALHATVIGVSQDGIEKLKKFSISECRSKFPVASDKDGTISKSYDAVLSGLLGYSARTSYVIAPTGQIVYAYNALDPDGHVANTMKAVQDWNTAHPTK